MHTLRFERYCPAYHGKKKHTQTPNVCSETLIATIRNNLWSNVCWSAALFRDLLVFLNNSAYAEITNLNIAIFIQKDIVKLDVSVEHRSAMAVSDTKNYLLEYSSSLALIESPSLLNELQQISAASILHHHEQVFGRFEDFKESDDVGVANLLQDLYFLQHFLLLIVIFHQGLVDCFDSNNLSCKLVDSKGNFSEGSLADEFHELVVVDTCDRDLRLYRIGEVLDIGYQFISFFSNLVGGDKLVESAPSRCEVLVRQRLQSANVNTFLIRHNRGDKVCGSSPMIRTRLI